MIGQFHWLATHTRPGILFECCDLLGKIKSPTTDAKRANKLVNNIKKEEIVVTLKKEDNLSDYKLFVFCDASFANMSGDGSQGQHIFFWSNAFGYNINPIAWQSHRIKRIVNSITLTADPVALMEASGKTYWIRWYNQWNFPNYCLPVICLTDSKTLYHAVKSSQQMASKQRRLA